MKIRAGPNTGCRWSLSAAGRHRSGHFEADRVGAILALLRPGDCVWDIGAHYGYVTLAASRAVGAEGHVYALEPSAYNHAYLRRHLEWNGCENVTPLKLGVAGAPGAARFGGTGSSQTFRLGGGSEVVEVTSIRAMMASGLRRPDVIKIDTEGAEADILTAGVPHLPPAAAFIVSIHAHHDYERCLSALAGTGFSVFLSAGVQTLKDRATWGGDPDVIAVGPERGDLLPTVSKLPGFAAVDGAA
ncbi:MAG: FkbM family methyltransferase [Gemmatimonadota bacterium]